MSSSTSDAYVYEQFKEVGRQSYRTIVQFWDAHQKEIARLDIAPYFDLLNEYARALFELGKYRSFIQTMEEILALSFEYNLTEWDGKNILTHGLLKKAAAHFHLYENETAQELLCQLLRLEPEHKTAKLLFQRCMYRKSKERKQSWRQITVIFMLTTALIVAAELFVIQPYYSSLANTTEWIRISCFSIGLVVWVGGEVLQYYHVRQKCKQLLHQLS